MIVIHLKGGMGNQMFQYALGRRLANDLKTDLKLDISGYEKSVKRWNPFKKGDRVDTKRHYDLNHFKIIEDFATKHDLARIGHPAGFVSELEDLFRTKILRQFHIGFEPKILKLKGNVYLDGLWHSEKYFTDIRKLLLRDFSLKKPLSAAGEAIGNEIKNSPIPTVALHVRRGDYANDPYTLKYHGLLAPQYYQEAINILKRSLGGIKIYFFSDDIDWVKQNLPTAEPHVYVSGPQIPYYEEITLMSLCNHNIIANSSFSWWGAWLNDNKEKIVIAPEKWLAETGNDFYEEIPKSWVKI